MALASAEPALSLVSANTRNFVVMKVSCVKKKSSARYGSLRRTESKSTLMMKQMKLQIEFFVDLTTFCTENRATSFVSRFFLCVLFCGYSFAALVENLRHKNLFYKTEMRPSRLTTTLILIELAVFFSAIC